jgi:serine protease
MHSGRVRMPSLVVVLLAVFACASLPARSAGAIPAAPASASDGFLVKLRATAGASGYEPAPGRIAALAARNGLEATQVQHIFSGIHLLRVRAAAGAAPTAALALLRADREVDYAELNQRRYPLATPDDTLFASQWYLQSAQPAAIDAQNAWDVTTGVPGLVIADLDTGVRFDHPDLRNTQANRLLPGYNLISNAATANNAYGRGSDASDPGDWISTSDQKMPQFASCPVANSSWHGTRVAGILGAISNNEMGITGATWEGWIEPVRVLGKCGGYDSDIIAAMAWAAGDHVDGVPDNPYPAQILNMSLGASGPCPSSYQQMVDELLAQGVLIVVSAGNEGGPVDAPANCIGAVGVAGLRQIGTKVGYSSLGPEIALAAPAGNCVNTAAGPCLFSIETTTNSGTTVPAAASYTDEYHFNVGTSFSAPLVSAIAGLMLAVNGNLTPPQLIGRLQAGAQPFPVSADPTVPYCHVPASPSDLQTGECNCTANTCGAGMANANGAVLQALRPIAALSVPAAFAPGSTVLLDASGSAAACNATIVSYQWSFAPPLLHAPPISNAGSARASIVAPAAPLSYTLMLTVTDDHGRTDSAPVTIGFDNGFTPAPASAGEHACLAAVSYSTAPPNSGTPSGSGTSSGSGSSSGGSASGGGGGGGALDPWTLTLATLAAALAAGGRYSRRCAASSQGRCARR